MDRIIIPASITLERGFSTKKYKWKSGNKISNYRRPCKRAFIRFTARNFANKISNMDKDNRQIDVRFLNNSYASVRRAGDGHISLQGYSGVHPYIQFIVNRILPNSIWDTFEKDNKKSLTIPINLEIYLDEWKDIKLTPSDFILEIESEAKSLMNLALSKGFQSSRISKGREYDIELITPNKKKFIIALSSHVAKTKSRSKDKTIQKILMDIAKMLPFLHENKDVTPVIVTRPIEFDNSWSHTTKKYLNFYKEKFSFVYLTTEFKNGWEDNIIKEILKI